MEQVRVSVSPKTLRTADLLLPIVASELGIELSEIATYRIAKESLDARGRKPKFHATIEVYFQGENPDFSIPKPDYQNIEHAKHSAVIIGAGPTGLFAALRLIELGIKPIVWERGKDVRKRRFDLKAIQRDDYVHPDSNYCFGEGGAGTYSDGKLYTRSTKRGDVRRILEILVAHGASPEILVNSHPHIGTNKLPKLVQDLRETILEFGGEVHFERKMVDITIQEQKISEVIDQHGISIPCEELILATGHSARDIFELLQKKEIEIEAKPFAMGVRIEHPQQLIDSIQYNCGPNRGPYLPAASYSLVHQVQGRGVYSFCMCPGGFIVPSATAAGEIVVNGMSPSKRDNQFANSGFVVEVKEEDWKAYGNDALAAMRFQTSVEQQAFSFSNGSQKAPAQRMLDFVNGTVSKTLNDTSYQPGLVSTPLNSVFPSAISSRLKGACEAFGKKMRGYLTNEANLIGVESRTSSPVRIPRDNISLQHTRIQNLYPGGEGAGYAGGIISAAIDGERIANAISKKL